MTRDTRSRGVATLLALATCRIAALPAAGHGADHSTGHTPWTRWTAVVALVAGVGLVGAGVVLDRQTDGRNPRSDALVVAGTVVALLSMAMVWL